MKELLPFSPTIFVEKLVKNKLRTNNKEIENLLLKQLVSNITSTIKMHAESYEIKEALEKSNNNINDLLNELIELSPSIQVAIARTIAKFESKTIRDWKALNQ